MPRPETQREKWAEDAERNLYETFRCLERARVHLDALKRILAQGGK